MSENKTPSHYSPATKFDNLVFTSGQLPLLDPVTKETPEGITEQTKLALQKLENVIKPYGLDRNDILKTTAFISNMDDWAAVNQVYADFFGDHKPSRSIIPCRELHYGCQIEIEGIAGIKNA